jgi:glycosyltransferase involved in cell wall biosynthesis
VESPEKFGFCIAKYTHVESPLNNRQPVQMLNDGQQPAVSVVIPCYNHAGFLAKAVESVVNQTFTDWECIIVNDGSHDDTAQVAESLTWKYLDKKINIITQANHGLPTARNAGIKASKGRYILPLDADDLIHPEMLQKTVSLLDTHPEIAIAYTDIKQIGSVNRIVYTGE